MSWRAWLLALALLGGGCASDADDTVSPGPTTTALPLSGIPVQADDALTSITAATPRTATTVIRESPPRSTTTLASTTTSSSTSTTSTTTSTTTPPPEPRSFVVMATGDILTEQLVLDAATSRVPGERYDFAPLFAPITTGIESADLAICHMELPIGAPGARPGVYGRSPDAGNLLLAPYEIAGAVADAGFDRCSTASNHTLDLGYEGIASTLDALDAAGLGHVGTARVPEEAVNELITVNEVTVAHLAYTRFTNMPRTGERWWMNWGGDVEQVAQDVLDARAAGAEIVVISLHIAKEMLAEPTGYDRAFVMDLTATAPIDLIVEHGPHVIQPVEIVNGTVVYWSVGNLLSGMGVPGTGKYEDLRTLDGIIAGVRFTEVLDDSTAPARFVAEPLPVLICSERSTRTVYAPFTAVDDPTLPDGVRSQMEACITRATRVQADLR